MDPLMVLLRVVHIVFGIYIVGSYLFMAPILEPRLKRVSHPVQVPVMSSLMPVLTPVNAISFIIIIGTGMALTLIMRGGSLNTLFVTGWGSAIIIGLVATLATAVVGFVFIIPTGMHIDKLSRSIKGRPSNPHEGVQLHQLSVRVEALSGINLVLIIVALSTMILSGYL